MVLLLAGSLLGSYINIPVAELPAERIYTEGIVSFFGMQYVVPQVLTEPKTILALNLGGAVIPTILSVYLMVKHRIYLRSAMAVIVVAGLVHLMARPVGRGDCGTDVHAKPGHGERGAGPFQEIRRSAGLHRRKPRHAHWRGPHEPGPDPRARGTGRLDWGRRHLRRDFLQGSWRCCWQASWRGGRRWPDRARRFARAGLVGLRSIARSRRAFKSDTSIVCASLRAERPWHRAGERCIVRSRSPATKLERRASLT